MSAGEAAADPAPITVGDPRPRDLRERIAAFVRQARDNDFRVGIAETLDAQRLVVQCGLDDPGQFRWQMRSLLCGNREDWRRFDELFERFWLPANRQTLQRGGGEGGGSLQRTQGPGAGGGRRTADSGDGDAGVADPGGASGGASAQEHLEREDFAAMADRGRLRAAERRVEEIARRIQRVATRRERIERRGRRLSMRHTIRGSLRYGGTPLKLAFRRRRPQLPRIVIITDVSRSMSVYSHFFLRFARGIIRVFGSADAFAFHSHLVPISEALRQPDHTRLAQSLALISAGWSGGTRLGDSLQQLNRRYGGLINRRTLVIVVSDGLDTSPPETLGREIAALRARCRRLIWLNPLLGREGYRPLTGSMQAALPFIDLFAPAHNLESLAALEDELAVL